MELKQNSSTYPPFLQNLGARAGIREMLLISEVRRRPDRQEANRDSGGVPANTHTSDLYPQPQRTFQMCDGDTPVLISCQGAKIAFSGTDPGFGIGTFIE